MQRNDFFNRFNAHLSSSNLLLRVALMIALLRQFIGQSLAEYADTLSDSSTMEETQRVLLLYSEVILTAWALIMMGRGLEADIPQMGNGNEKTGPQQNRDQDNFFKRLGSPLDKPSALACMVIDKRPSTLLPNDKVIQTYYTYLLMAFGSQKAGKENALIQRQVPSLDLPAKLKEFITVFKDKNLTSCNAEQIFYLWNIAAALKFKIVEPGVDAKAIDRIYDALEKEVPRVRHEYKVGFDRSNLIQNFKNELAKKGYIVQKQGIKVFTFMSVGRAMIDVIRKEADYLINDKRKIDLTVSKLIQHALLKKVGTIQRIFVATEEELSGNKVGDTAEQIACLLRMAEICPVEQQPKPSSQLSEEKSALTLEFVESLEKAPQQEEKENQKSRESGGKKFDFFRAGGRTYNQAKSMKGRANRARQQQRPFQCPTLDRPANAQISMLQDAKTEPAKPISDPISEYVLYEQYIRRIFMNYRGDQTESLMGYQEPKKEKTRPSLPDQPLPETKIDFENQLEQRISQQEFSVIKDKLEEIDSVTIEFLIRILLKLKNKTKNQSIPDKKYKQLISYCINQVCDELNKEWNAIKDSTDAEVLFCYTLSINEIKRIIEQLGLSERPSQKLMARFNQATKSKLEIIKNKLQVQGPKKNEIQQKSGNLILTEDHRVRLVIDKTQSVLSEIDRHLTSQPLLMLQAIYMAAVNDVMLDKDLIVGIRRNSKLLHPSYSKAIGGSYSNEEFNNLLNEYCSSGCAAKFFEQLIQLGVADHLFPSCYASPDENRSNYVAWILPSLRLIDQCVTSQISMDVSSYMTAILCAKELARFSPEERQLMIPKMMEFYGLTAPYSFSIDPVQLILDLYAQLNGEQQLVTQFYDPQTQQSLWGQVLTFFGPAPPSVVLVPVQNVTYTY